MIGEDHVRAGALDGREYFHHDAVAVDPAEFGPGLDHGELAAHVVRGNGEVEGLLHQSNRVGC